MKAEAWLARAAKELGSSGISTARLDALVLLEDATGKDRAWILAHTGFELQASNVQKLDKQIKRRAAHEPLAYIRGKSEFYGREFKVTPATLQPRPETETMLELLFEQVESGKLKVGSVIDVGTGSGAIAITAKLEWPEVNVYATEINGDALEVARQNARKLDADIQLYQGNLLEPLTSGIWNLESGKLAILANLPYVPDSHTINQAAMQEPKVAIFGGEDGLDLYRELFTQISNIKYQILVMLTESLPFQHQALADIARTAGYELQQTEDFIQIFCPA